VNVREALYGAAVLGVRGALTLARPFHRKLARGLDGRRGAVEALEAWAARERDLDRPLVWVHAPSVGEALMAQAIVAAARECRPDLQVAFTHFSPSTERIASRVGADVHGYLPWDAPGPMRRALAALRPAAIAFIRTEIWPVLTREAQAAGCRLALLNAVLAASSSRLRPAARFALRPAYARLDVVGAVSDDDAARFPLLGVPRSRVRTTGDARFDQVWARVQGAGRGSGARALAERLRAERGFTLVAGSTWPPDERVVVPAFARLLGAGPARLIIAPHEPDDAHLAGLERRLDEAGLRHRRLARVEAGEPPADVVVIDRVGVLADLYAAADAAYVGGGFHRAGLHSVVEPAALEVPVLFGPRHGNAREAAELAAAGGGWEVRDADTLAAALSRLASDGGARAAAGAAAVAYVRSRLGGARANAEALVELL
jgi:3-deoxy-D-manno-octulosonic-acid transferase